MSPRTSETFSNILSCCERFFVFFFCRGTFIDSQNFVMYIACRYFQLRWKEDLEYFLSVFFISLSNHLKTSKKPPTTCYDFSIKQLKWANPTPQSGQKTLERNEFNPSTDIIKCKEASEGWERNLKNLLGVCVFNKYWDRITLQIPINQVMVINRKINRRKSPEEPKFLKFLSMFRVEPHIGPRKERKDGKRGKKSFLSGRQKREDGKFMAKRYRKNK